MAPKNGAIDVRSLGLRAGVNEPDLPLRGRGVNSDLRVTQHLVGSSHDALPERVSWWHFL